MRPLHPTRRSLRRRLASAATAGLILLSLSVRAEVREGLSAYQHGDYERAAGLLAPLADQGDARAQYVMGRMRFYGQALAQDAAAAASWYRRSAEQGYGPAQFALGIALEGGWGVPRAPEEAVRWYRRAAVQGVEGAMWRLAYHYRRGVGVARNLEEAWAWFDRLAMQGDLRAVSERDWLALVGLDEGGLLRARARSSALGRELAAAALDRHPTASCIPIQR